ncbi:hypothetical protein [Streptomyces sp. NBC_01443]|uniref:hypothetical protein n=1 Tax=Streptomyces sp. NBC_01443 TaxID=2903868 RepID=UPI00225BF459|nr:hypothetical protein [Streptomyces sp. NBC_01443]MCX4631600.1 hypothetical protein [Streptomyces sp. NBC_01443]
MGRSENQIREGGGPAHRAESTTTTVPDRWRYARHLDALAAAAGTTVGAEADVVAEVLRDRDPVMAESAVVTHLDRRAAHLLTDAGFPGWARAMDTAIGARAFPARRLREWTLLKAITDGVPWSPAELTAASDWCQRTAARSLPSYEALDLLAATARTRRVRNAAAQRLHRRNIAS